MKILLRWLVLLLGGLPASSIFSQNDIQDEVSYSNDIQPIIRNFCTTCHAGDDPEGDLVLSTYQQVRIESEKGTLLDRINDHRDPMPEDGLMPTHLRRLFKIWSETGYLNQGTQPKTKTMSQYQEFTPPKIDPIDVTIHKQGFELLELLQGHWVGPMKLMGTDYDWMAFDYRPISPSHVHGIFEGGTIGNLFTSFFVAKYKGKQTIVARNGGILNGIYRTSYFVLDKVERRRSGSYYRLVDAYGGKNIMYMELTFSRDSMVFNAYTSRMGLKSPKLHMGFRAKRKRPELSAAAAKAVGFPRNQIAFEFPDPLPIPTWASDYPLTSASYLHEAPNLSIIELGKRSKDPIRIDQMPYLSQLKLTIGRNSKIKGKKLHAYLSQKALTEKSGKFISKWGYIRTELLDTLLLYPELGANTDEFTFTYLHPGDYFLTIVADMDGDGYPSKGDLTHPLTPITVRPNTFETISVKGITVQN